MRFFVLVYMTLFRFKLLYVVCTYCIFHRVFLTRKWFLFQEKWSAISVRHNNIFLPKFIVLCGWYHLFQSDFYFQFVSEMFVHFLFNAMTQVKKNSEKWFAPTHGNLEQGIQQVKKVKNCRWLIFCYPEWWRMKDKQVIQRDAKLQRSNIWRLSILHYTNLRSGFFFLFPAQKKKLPDRMLALYLNVNSLDTHPPPTNWPSHHYLGHYLKIYMSYMLLKDEIIFVSHD